MKPRMGDVGRESGQRRAGARRAAPLPTKKLSLAFPSFSLIVKAEDTEQSSNRKHSGEW